jgi:ribonuclease P protein component
MISVRNRFHGYGSLNAVYRNGQTVRGPMMSLKFLDRSKKSGFRAAIVVSRKVHKSAVVRNRIRRRLYEIIRQADTNLTDHKDLVLTVFSEQIAEMPAEKLKKSTEDLLQKTRRG